MAKAKLQEEPESQQRARAPQSPQSGIARRERGISPWTVGPEDLFSRLADDIERLFDNFGFRPLPSIAGRWPGLGRTGQGIWSPQIEVLEREGSLIVRADLPGLRKDDIKVEISDDRLTLKGERRQEDMEEREGYYRSERSYGGFYRSIPLPAGVNANDAKASFRDGVLEVTIPAPQLEKRGRQVQVE
jgi:HSP20 family protein